MGGKCANWKHHCFQASQLLYFRKSQRKRSPWELQCGEKGKCQAGIVPPGRGQKHIIWETDQGLAWSSAKLPDPSFSCACIAVGTVDNRHQRKTSQHPDSVPGPSPKCGSQQSLEAILAATWKLSHQAATSWVLPASTACLLLFLHLWCAPYAVYFRLIQKCLGCRQGCGREVKWRKHDRKATIIHYAQWTVMAPNPHLMLLT